jgi:hypothetical protein
MSNAMSAVRTRRQEIGRTIQRLKAEDRDLATAEEVLTRFEAGRGGLASEPVDNSSLSQRALVIKLLSTSDSEWLRSGDILLQIKERYGVDIPERSVRPLLSVMKGAGVIVRRGRLVALADRVRSGGSPSGR